MEKISHFYVFFTPTSKNRHQIFGENERIEDLDSDAVVVVRFDPSLRNVHVEIESSDEVSESKKKKLVQKLGKYLPADPELDRDVFLQNCVASADKQIVQSDLLKTYQDRDGDTFEMPFCRLEEQ